MTEKLFKLFVGNNYGVKTADGDVIFDSIRSIGDAEFLVDWLNDLFDENKQLKEENKELRQKYQVVMEIRKEIEK